jgi:hypothetical protein
MGPTLLTSGVFSIKEFVLSVVGECGELLKYASDELKQDSDVVIKAFRNQHHSLRYAPVELLKNPAFLVRLIASGGRLYLKYANPVARNDPEVVVLSLKWCARNLEHASSFLKNDRSIVLTAIKTHWKSFKFASENLRNDCDICLAALEQNWKAVKLIPLPVLANNDIDFHSKVIHLQPSLFKFYNFNNLGDNYEYMMAAVSRRGRYLEYASEGLKNNRSIVEAAVKQNFTSLEFAPQKFCEDKGIIIIALSQTINALKYVSPMLYDDRDVMLHIVKQNGLALQYTMRRDRDIVLAAVTQCGSALQYATLGQRKNDLEIVIAAVKQDGFNWKFAVAPMSQNFEVLLHTARKSAHALRRVLEAVTMRDKFEGWVSDYYHRYSVSCAVFRSTFLFGIIRRPSVLTTMNTTTTAAAAVIPNISECKLIMLNKLGRYRLEHVKLLIADYVGLQFGERWKLFSSAKVALAPSKPIVIHLPAKPRIEPNS